MSPRDTSIGLSSRRRPSLSFRARPRTATHSIPFSKENVLDQWREASLEEICHDHNASAVEDMEHFPDAVPRRRAAKSFSSLRHPVDGLVALGRRLSVSIRTKSSKQNLRVPGEGEEDSECHYRHVSGQQAHKRNVVSGSWGHRSRAWSNSVSINRRPSLNSVSALHGFYAPTATVPAPIPGHGLEPPILPNDMYAGSAARAAAAAQNEQIQQAKLELARAEQDLLEKADMRLTQDSESGIGIDLRDYSDSSNTDLNIVRIGMDHDLNLMRVPETDYLQTLFLTFQPRSCRTSFRSWILRLLWSLSLFPVPGINKPLRLMSGSTYFVEHTPAAREAAQQLRKSSLSGWVRIFQTKTGRGCFLCGEHSSNAGRMARPLQSTCTDTRTASIVRNLTRPKSLLVLAIVPSASGTPTTRGHASRSSDRLRVMSRSVDQ